MQSVFQLVDEDKDGVASMKEFIRVVQTASVLAHSQRAANNTTSNKNGGADVGMKKPP